jgi:hypothetical protein
MFRELGIVRELSTIPTGKPFRSADPKRSISSRDQASNFAAGEVLTDQRPAWNIANSVEPKQAELRCEPEIPVRRLSNRMNRSSATSLADSPRRVGILIHIERWVQRKHARAPQQQLSGTSASRVEVCRPPPSSKTFPSSDAEPHDKSCRRPSRPLNTCGQHRGRHDHPAHSFLTDARHLRHSATSVNTVTAHAVARALSHPSRCVEHPSRLSSMTKSHTYEQHRKP